MVPTLGDYRLSDLRRAEVQALADELLGSGLRHRACGTCSIHCGRSTAMRSGATRIRSTLPGISSFRHRDVSRHGSRWPLKSAQCSRVLPPEERALWATGFYAGLRPGELCALRWFDVELGSSEIRVARSWDQYEGSIDPKSKTDAGTLPILAVLRAYLDAHKIATSRTAPTSCSGGPRSMRSSHRRRGTG